MRRAALASALAARRDEHNVRVVDGMEAMEPKTKRMAAVLAAIGVKSPVLLVTGAGEKLIGRSARNIQAVDVLPALSLTTYAVMTHPSILMTRDALKELKDLFARHI